MIKTMKRRWVQILVAVIVILVFVLSYVDFGPAVQQPPPADFDNPTEPPQIKGPTGPPPAE